MKEIMDGYIGVKYKPILIEPNVPFDISAVFAAFEKNCQRLKQHGMTPQNAGNISVRQNRGFIITASGSNLGNLEPAELVYVDACSTVEGVVRYMGSALPSSEAFMHSRIYACGTEVQAVVHAHDHETLQQAAESIQTTEHEVPYGTLTLADMACAAFEKAENIIVLKNHGYVAVGESLHGAVDLVVATHLSLKAAA